MLAFADLLVLLLNQWIRWLLSRNRTADIRLVRDERRSGRKAIISENCVSWRHEDCCLKPMSDVSAKNDLISINIYNGLDSFTVWPLPYGIGCPKTRCR